jgi:hypothetical protein
LAKESLKEGIGQKMRFILHLRFERRGKGEELLGAFFEEERTHEVKGLGGALAWH